MPAIKHIEIVGPDGNALRDFYARLFGWSITGRKLAGFDYYDIETGGEPTAAIRPEPDVPPEIVVYIEVANVDQSVERAEALGASVRIPPTQHGDLRFALIEDPAGNAIGLTQAAGDGRD